MENSKLKTVVIDGYLDEPSCLGVPPYISPHIRYLWGALIDAGLDREKMKYITIDDFRDKKDYYFNELENYDILIVIAGTTVPGHYMGGKPASAAELEEISEKIFYPTRVLGGPITLINNMADRFEKNYDIISSEITAVDIYQRLQNTEIESGRFTEMIDRWAVMGADVVKLHPSYPDMIAELETFRGCPRASHCAFCSERLKKIKYSRNPAGIAEEVNALAENGIHNYRLGSQTDLLLYGAEASSGKFIPSSEKILDLYQGIRSADPELKVLHMDNINPATIARYPEISAQILEIITEYNTAGDIAAFGVESADPLVLKKNNIDTTVEESIRAIKMVNEIGGRRENGIPKLLPGINFLHGLIGEREETFEYNFNYLKKILDMGLMLRRINIRQVFRLGSYPEVEYSRGQFMKYKKKVNEEINRVMLQRVFPYGTEIRDLYVDKRKGNLTFARQLGSYPILVGIPGHITEKKIERAKIVDHGYRSITALKWPKTIDDYKLYELEAVPGIGSKRAARIISEQPRNISQLKNIIGDSLPIGDISQWFIFNNQADS
ncbi:MAG: radical SAM protein [Bacillota bacterium]